MSDYENLQKLAYGLVVIMFVFYFVESLVIYKQELVVDDDGASVELNYRLEDIRWELPDEDMDGSRDISYDYIAFEEIEKVMQYMKNLALLLIIASAFLNVTMPDIDT